VFSAFVALFYIVGWVMGMCLNYSMRCSTTKFHNLYNGTLVCRSDDNVTFKRLMASSPDYTHIASVKSWLHVK